MNTIGLYLVIFLLGVGTPVILLRLILPELNRNEAPTEEPSDNGSGCLLNAVILAIFGLILLTAIITPA